MKENQQQKVELAQGILRTFSKLFISWAGQASFPGSFVRASENRRNAVSQYRPFHSPALQGEKAFISQVIFLK